MLEPWHALLLLGLCLLTLVPLFVLGNRIAAATGQAETINEVISLDQFPRKLRKAVEERSAKYFAAGFELACDLKTSRRGTTSFGRYYLSQDRCTVAEIAIFQLGPIPMSRVQAEMTSLLDDGTILQSTSRSAIPSYFSDLDDRDRLKLVAMGTTDPASMLEKHEASVARTSETDGTATLPLSAAFIPEMNDFTLRLVDWFLYRKGTLPDPPPTGWVHGKQLHEVECS